MSIKKNLLLLSFGLATCVVSLQAVAEDWHFVVKNKTTSNITKLEVSQDKSSWGNFDIGSGIGPGEKATMVWASSTDDQKCHQWIRAKFCHDLDDPIEFTE
jgi:hypothetical protein